MTLKASIKMPYTVIINISCCSVSVSAIRHRLTWVPVVLGSVMAADNWSVSHSLQASDGASCPLSMIYSSVPVPEASLREALLVIGGAMVELAELVELGAVEVVQLVAEVLKLLVDGRDNERRVKISGGALEKNLQELITDLTRFEQL